jgi:GTP-binding protein
LRIKSSRFERSAFRPEDEPKAQGPDVVFMGRSNVGKSSLINRLLGTKNLARTSSTPGRTQSVNFYRINESFYFVDLPGYGYARVPEKIRKGWGPMIEGFLERRGDRIAMAVLLLDARHEPTALDRAMRDWLESREIRYVTAATKSDKLSGNGREKAARRIRGEFDATRYGSEPILVSARTGLGIREVWRRLDAALGVA